MKPAKLQFMEEILGMNQGGGQRHTKDSAKSLETQSRREVEIDLVERFQNRCIELARQGTFGSLRTRKASLQNTWAHLLSLLDQPHVPILIYGEKGSGKRRLVDEFITSQNFCRRIAGAKESKLKVFSPSFIKEGFTQLFLDPYTSSFDVIYFEKVDELSLEHQEELLGHLKVRKHFSEKDMPLPRLIFSTQRALSLLMIQKQFSRELFSALTGFAVFLPSLNERSEDLPEIIQSISSEACGKRQIPKAAIVDILSRQLWPENLDELKKCIQNMLAKNSDMSTWTEKDLPQSMQAHSKSAFVRISKEDLAAQSAEKIRIQQALVAAGGDRKLAANRLGLSRGDLLNRLMSLGIR